MGKIGGRWQYVAALRGFVLDKSVVIWDGIGVVSQLTEVGRAVFDFFGGHWRERRKIGDLTLCLRGDQLGHDAAKAEWRL